MFIVTHYWDSDYVSNASLVGKYITLEDAKAGMKEAVNVFMERYAHRIGFLPETYSDDEMNCSVNIEDVDTNTETSVHWGILEV